MQTFSINEKEYCALLKEKEKLLSKLNPDISFKEFFELVEKE